MVRKGHVKGFTPFSPLALEWRHKLQSVLSKTNKFITSRQFLSSGVVSTSAKRKGKRRIIVRTVRSLVMVRNHLPAQVGQNASLSLSQLRVHPFRKCKFETRAKKKNFFHDCKSIVPFSAILIELGIIRWNFSSFCIFNSDVQCSMKRWGDFNVENDAECCRMTWSYIFKKNDVTIVKLGTWNESKSILCVIFFLSFSLSLSFKSSTIFHRHWLQLRSSSHNGHKLHGPASWETVEERCPTRTIDRFVTVTNTPRSLRAIAASTNKTRGWQSVRGPPLLTNGNR